MADTRWIRYKNHLIRYAKGGGRQYPHWHVENASGKVVAALHTKGAARKWIDDQGRSSNPHRRGANPRGKVPPHLRRYLFKKGHR